MNEETVRAFKAGIDAIKGARDECETVADYLGRLIETYDASPQAAEVALPQYMNIIRDELNHALRFMLNVFVPVTGIEPEFDGIEEAT
ncbi:MAG: hypothetical protein K2L51_06715 [Clostridiales bacterium]|nr:hypothetical protein [Clostridiales bacterium]